MDYLLKSLNEHNMSITVVFIFKMYYEFGIVINDLIERLILNVFFWQRRHVDIYIYNVLSFSLVII